MVEIPSFSQLHTIDSWMGSELRDESVKKNPRVDAALLGNALIPVALSLITPAGDQP